MSMTVGDEREPDEEQYNSKEVSITHTSRESSDVMWHDAAHNSQLPLTTNSEIFTRYS